MERADDTQDFTGNGSSSKNDINLDNEFGIKYGTTPELEETNPSITTPLVPNEIPTNEVN
ncbi:MAG: hypothetical protein K0S01_3977 [Herbinix sp.]|jgi:hypothetical protein|nr:hypothetical protein [Herbinix sp.]